MNVQPIYPLKSLFAIAWLQNYAGNKESLGKCEQVFFFLDNEIPLVFKVIVMV